MTSSSLNDLIDLFSKLPSLGPRSARRAVLYLLKRKTLIPKLVNSLEEVQAYMNSVTDRMNKGVMLHANDLEEFLDHIADKYWINADATTERIYGKKDIANTDYMKLLDKKSS